MNGFTMWILLAATGQVGDTVERDYGWQINPSDGKLEYIVQLSPEKANYMASAAKEQESEVPPEVAARLSRVVVRIGTEPLVSTPIEEVVKKVPPVSRDVLANIEAIAGRGQFAQLESEPSGEVRNISGDRSPPPLSSSSSTPLPDTLGTLADQASELRSNLSGSSSRKSDPLRAPENLLAQNTASSSFLNDSRGIGTGTGKYSNTGTQPATPSAGSGSPPTGSQSGIVGPMPPTSTYPTLPVHSHAPGEGAHIPGAGGPSLSGSPSGIYNGSSSTGNLGTGGLGNSTYPGGPSSLPGANTGATAGQPYSSPSGIYGTGQTPANNQPPSYSNTTPNYNSGQGYGMTPMNNGSLNSGSLNNGNFGGFPRGTSSPAPYNEYATVGTGSAAGTQYPLNPSGYPYPAGSNSQSPVHGWQASPYASDPLSLPSGNHQPTRVADNRAFSSLPTTSGSGAPTGNLSSTQGSVSSNPGKVRAPATANDADIAESYASRSGVENVLPVMFVLSLVVNFYLGMLIRKLLTRYRSLLSSVRSQAV